MALVLDLRASICECELIEFTVPSGGLNTGDYYALEDVKGIVLTKDGKAAAKDEKANLLVRVPAPGIVLPKSTTTGQNTFAVGEKVYWDVAEGALANESSGNVLLGIALEAATRLETTVRCTVNGIDA